MDWSIIIPIVIALVAASPGIYTAFVQRKRDDNDLMDRINKAAVALIEPLHTEVDRLREQLEEAEKENKNLEEGLDNKEIRIRELESACGKFKELERTVNVLTEENGRLKEQIVEKDGQIATLQKEIDELRRRMVRVEKTKKEKTQPLP